MSNEESLSLSMSCKLMDTTKKCGLLFLETSARSTIGQTIFHFVDRFLWIVEKSVQWSLPPQEINEGENGNTFGKVELVRPLPWIFFLTALILLRLFRFGLNIGALMLGHPKIEPLAMVKFLQKSRRRLRGIKSNGMKNMRQGRSCAKDNDCNVDNTKWRSAQLLKTIQSTLSNLSCLDNSKMSPSPPPTRIKVEIGNERSTPTPDEKSTTESVASPTRDDVKRKYSELSSEEHFSEDSEEETIRDKIERLANENNDSMEDDDYRGSGVSSTEEESISGESNISARELQDIRDEANLILHRALAGVTEVIKEEPETIKRMSVNQKTGEDEKLVNSNEAYTSGNCDDFYSPYKLGEDSETAFYSPISSTSPSPDRMVPIFKQGQQSEPIENTTEVMDPCENGEENISTEAHDNSGKTTNGHTVEKRKVPINVLSKYSKSHNRGKRANHASRKKK